MSEIPQTPNGFLKDQKEDWNKIWSGNPHLSENRDYYNVQMLVEIWSEYRIFLKLSKKDRVHSNPNGTVQLHPYVQQTETLRKSYLSLVKILGLSPLDASALSLVDLALEDKKKEMSARPSRQSIIDGAE